MARHRTLRLETPAGINVSVGVGDLSVVGAGELDLPLRCGQLLATRASVLQRSHFGGVAEREGEREDSMNSEKGVR